MLKVILSEAMAAWGLAWDLFDFCLNRKTKTGIIISQESIAVEIDVFFFPGDDLRSWWIFHIYVSLYTSSSNRP